MPRHVKGSLLIDFASTVRKSRTNDWGEIPEPEHIKYLLTNVEPERWYPIEALERLGNAILEHVAHGDIRAAGGWGRMSVDALLASSPNLLSPGDPMETLMRFRVYRSTLFDFEALTLPTLVVDHAEVAIGYGMGSTAEQAASFQTMGFFERLLELAGADAVAASFKERAWEEDERTLMVLSWEPPLRA